MATGRIRRRRTKRQVMANVRRLLNDASMGLERALKDAQEPGHFSPKFRTDLRRSTRWLGIALETGRKEWRGR